MAVAGWLEGPTGRVEQVRTLHHDHVHDHEDHADGHHHDGGVLHVQRHQRVVWNKSELFMIMLTIMMILRRISMMIMIMGLT